MPPSASERALRWVLRYLGLVSMLALVAVFMPYTWMDAIHRALGMGPLPSQPVVGYLARSLSLFYALLGGLLWLLAAHPRRHRDVLRYLAGAFIVFGVILFGVDQAEGLPPLWRCAEGPMVIAFGLLIACLSARLSPAGRDCG
jgi:hypothetical protein